MTVKNIATAAHSFPDIDLKAISADGKKFDADSAAAFLVDPRNPAALQYQSGQ